MSNRTGGRGSPRRRLTTGGQLDLAIAEETGDKPVTCRGLFSANYLRRHFPVHESFPKPDEIASLYESARRRWQDNADGLRNQNEAYTRTQFLDPLLTGLGWQFIPEAQLPRGTKLEKPDYCLFPDADRRQQAAAQPTNAATFAFADTVLEAKRWGHSLDKVSERETPGRFPAEQIESYLRAAKDATGRRFFNWAILTNGARWRLYTEHAGNGATFEFTLVDSRGQFCSLEDFRLFAALFRPAAFARDSEERCLLDRVREESLNRQLELEENLRDRIFDVLEDLANAFRDHAPNHITAADYPALYQTSLIFLYRLLFVLYAESRELLPVFLPPREGASLLYRNRFSLAAVVPRLKQPAADFQSATLCDLYQRLLDLFHLIDGDNEALNREAKVTRYNGGLLDATQNPHIERWRVPDRALAHVLQQLIFAQPPASGRRRQQQIVTDETVDYASLEVRQLGDIYEGLLGAHLEPDASGRLTLRNEKGENHREGIYYTPDWVVTYLVRETLQPLLDEIDRSPEVQSALRQRSEERRRDNSFAHAVLRLNVLDPAMGSGHFLVRATEYLADAIRKHPTTRVMTAQVVTHGQQRRTRRDIEAAGLVPVPPGISQQQAETAYWRRRVVEACIYGVDLNPLAVELTKLSLWLTCIAVDEPLNFLDHHLRHGNSLLAATPDELGHSPHATADERARQVVLPHDQLAAALRAVIAENHRIEGTYATHMAEVKDKERRWRSVRSQLQPFIEIADLWLAAADGLALNELDYQSLVRLALNQLPRGERAAAERLAESFAAELAGKRAAHQSFHWQLELADVFFAEDGSPRREEQRGFDAVLGNPPYITRQTMSGQPWLALADARLGYAQDTYEWFTRLSFRLLRPGGRIGFITADTFFTLENFTTLRELLQSHELTHLGQCDPFDATVDAALFVARKKGRAGVPPADSGVPPESSSNQTMNAPGVPPDAVRETRALPEQTLLFIQARPRNARDGRKTQPDKWLNRLPYALDLPVLATTPLPAELGTATHAQLGPPDAPDTLRVHRVPVALYRAAHKRAFFEPRPGTLRLFARFNDPVKRLVAQWWPRIETSEKFAENAEAIHAYQDSLRPGDVTLVGLVAQGGQGLATANNARFLGYLAGTPQAQDILARREAWTQRWLANPRIMPVFLRLLAEHGGDPAHPTRNSAAWEACIEPLRQQFDARELSFGKTDLYRIVPAELVAGDDDFQFAWQRRKEELLSRWRSHESLTDFWSDDLGASESRQRARKLKKAKTVSDADFCLLCQELQRWVAEENAARKRQRQPGIPRDALGLRSAENYSDPADAPRIATIYNGLSGRGQFVPFRKGDPEGNRWVENDPLFIDWNRQSVSWLFANSGRKGAQMPVVRNAHTFLASGIAFSRHGRDVALKFRYHPPSIYDAASPRLTSACRGLSTEVLLALLNSFIPTFFIKKFLNNTWYEMTDLRMMPLVLPTAAEARRLQQLAERAMEAKRLTFTGGDAPHALVAFARDLTTDLLARAPAYLHPPAQQRLLATRADCLEVIELAVNWSAEKLYGVEGCGPFNEF